MLLTNPFKALVLLLAFAVVSDAVLPAIFIPIAGLIGAAGKGTAEALKAINGEKVVKIVNTMGKDVEVTANCASGDDKIGEYKLKDGEGFAWKFKPNFFGNTLFWCDVSTNDGKSKHWDVYKGHDSSKYWYLRGDGGFTGNDNGSDLKKQWDF